MSVRRATAVWCGLLLAAAAHAEVAVTDDAGSRVALPAPAQRIVSLAPHVTELLFAAGADEQIVGAVEYSDYPPAARAIPRVGGYGAIDLEAILALNPVTFRYKQELDPDGIPQFGLVAEQVEKVNPDLVARDDQGKVNTVRYDAVNAMLLNEFLKEHRKVQELEATIARQQKEIEALAASLKEQT